MISLNQSIVQNTADNVQVAKMITDKQFEEKSCQIELLKQSTNDQECQTEEFLIQEEDRNEFSDFEQDEEELNFVEEKAHLFNSFANALIENMKLHG